MKTPFASKLFLLLLIVFLAALNVDARKRMPAGGRLAIVVDERLSALRATPELAGALVRRVSRGGLVAITTAKTSRDGIVFYKVNVSRGINGWMQRDAVVTHSRIGDDARLLKLIKASEDFDAIVRARIFLDYFRASRLRPEVLMIYSLTAEDVAARLSHDARRRLDENEMLAGGAPLFSYFLNYSGLDRYNRQGVNFVFDQSQKRFRYDGEGWRELVHRYPDSPQAAEARRRLGITVRERTN
ncbi:MAG TPA: hypothetical protein VJU84_03120 [Pyrinomonadaceae bacterium]|nr:hypothetical protein [Pyrinomonadaceae bacterium]